MTSRRRQGNPRSKARPRKTASATAGAAESGPAATIVSVGPDGALLDRRTVVLVDEGLPTHPHHHEGSWAIGRYRNGPFFREVSLEEALELVERVRRSAERRALAALRELIEDLPFPLGALALRSFPPLPPTAEERIRDPRAQTMADAKMYLDALASAARTLGVRVRRYDRSAVRRLAASSLGCSETELDDLLRELRRVAGAPWRARERWAAALAIAARRAL